MSADLLAEFDSFYQGSQPEQKPAAATARFPESQPSDPFSFLTGGPPEQTPHPPGVHPPQQRPQTYQQPPSVGGHGSLPALTSASSGSVPQPSLDEDDDGWGDFEVAPSAAPAPSIRNPAPAPIPPVIAKPTAVSNFQARHPEPQRTRIVRASTLDLMTNNLIDIGGLVAAPPKPLQEGSWDKPTPKALEAKAKHNDPNVLFDADDYDGAEGDDNDDEFGDFETLPAKPGPPPADLISPGFGSVQARSTAKPPSELLLSTLSLGEGNHSPYPQAPKSPSFQNRNPFPGLGVTTPKTAEFPKENKEKEPSPVTAWPSITAEGSQKPVANIDDGFNDEWASFEALPADKGKAEPSKGASLGWEWDSVDSTQQVPSRTADGKATGQSSSWDWDPVDGTQSSSPSQEPAKEANEPPPTNIPPPSVLLSLFPQLLEHANNSLFKPVNGQPAAVKDRVLTDARTIKFLRAYLLLAMVAARIIAGRKLRWHRDKFLSQGMKISAAGGKGGMKLAGIDKTQTAREDREAADVLSVWKQHVGRLRSAVAAANAAIADGSPQLRVPDLAENMAVQTAKMVATAPKGCFLCGLRRDERVARVDVDVEDSFGEWWVEHWGHRACRNFWLEHESKLRQR